MSNVPQAEGESLDDSVFYARPPAFVYCNLERFLSSVEYAVFVAEGSYGSNVSRRLGSE